VTTGAGRSDRGWRAAARRRGFPSSSCAYYSNPTRRPVETGITLLVAGRTCCRARAETRVDRRRVGRAGATYDPASLPAASGGEAGVALEVGVSTTSTSTSRHASS
jgi:hypothetical protein